MMEVVVTTGAIRRAKLQSNHHHQQTNTQLFTGQMPFLSPYGTIWPICAESAVKPQPTNLPVTQATVSKH